MRGNRPENTDIDRHIALNDAHQLNKVCMGRTGSEDTFIHIISTRSTAQLLATLNYFQQHYGQEFEKVGVLCCSNLSTKVVNFCLFINFRELLYIPSSFYESFLYQNYLPFALFSFCFCFWMDMSASVSRSSFGAEWFFCRHLRRKGGEN